MKLLRYGAPGREKPGIIDADGTLRDLSGIVKDIDGEMLASGGLAKIRKANILPGKRGAGQGGGVKGAQLWGKSRAQCTGGRNTLNSP